MEDIFKGVNLGIFVIGGHDAGKTFTSIGSISEPGFIFSFARQLFLHRAENSS